MSEKPEALCGIEWKRDYSHRAGQGWETKEKLFGHRAYIWLSADGDSWHCAWMDFYDSRSGFQPNERVTQIEEFILQARDELCAKTGTVAMQGWLPIATAPMDGTEIIGGAPYDVVCAIEWNQVAWYTSNGTAKLFYPTHWMPLPSVPEVE